MEESKKHQRNTQNWIHKGIQLTEEQIREAMSNTTSNMKAAEYLEVSYPTYKKYAKSYKDWETGKTLFELHANQSMKGVIGKTWVGGKIRVNWDTILRENQIATPERLAKLKNNIVEHNKLECKCYRCGYNEERIEDKKKPILLNFRNGDKTDWRIQNIEFVCYNCAFVYALDFFEESIVETVEAYMMNAKQGKKERSKFYQLDDFYIEHMNNLGVDIEELNKESIEKAELSQTSNNDFDDLIDYV